MNQLGNKPCEKNEQVPTLSRRAIMPGIVGLALGSPMLSGAANSAQEAVGDPKAEVEDIEQKLMWLYSNGLRKNLIPIMEYFDAGPNMLQYDLMSPREFKGPAFRKHFEDLVAQFESSIKVDIVDMHTWADNNKAFVASIQRNYGTDPKGNPFDFSMRVTDCFHKLDGKWKIVHEHVSFPIDNMVSAKPDFQSKL